MDELIQLAIWLAIIAFISALTGGKKKRPRSPGPPGSSPAPPVPAPRQRPAPRSLEPSPGASGPERPSAEPSLRDLLEILQGRAPGSVAPPEPEAMQEPLHAYPEAVSLETIRDDVRVLETVEPVNAETHRAFHDRYVDPVADARPARRPSRFRRVTPRTARDAVIWKTIFEKPKGLR